MSEWQRIDSAPKDGTIVLLREPGHLTGRIDHDHLVSGRWRQHHAYIAGGVWEDANHYVIQATHWMPLPDPPKV